MARSSALGAAITVEAEGEEQTAVGAVGHAVAEASRVVIRVPGCEEIDLPEALIKILRAAAAALSAGRSVGVLAAESVLTPAEAGELLGLSRPFVTRLLDQGQIPSQHLPNSTHRVVRLADILAYQSQREQRQKSDQRMASLGSLEGRLVLDDDWDSPQTNAPVA
jgi:excisionase family DNA binding protein